MFFNKNDFFDLATIIKPQGLNGFFSIKLNQGISEKTLIIDLPVFLITEGIPVPFLIEGIKHSGSYVLIKLKHIDTSDQALRFINSRILVESQEVETEEAEISEFEFMGYAVYDQLHGFIGNITAFNEIPGNPVFETTFDNKTIIIPFIDNFITEINHETKSLTISTPEGLIDIYLK